MKEKNKKKITSKQVLNTIYKVLEFIVLLPFRIIRFIFRFIYGILNILLIILAISGVFGLLVFSHVYPMYQESATQAYEKLSNLSESNFRMLSNTKIYDKNNKEIGEINAGDYKYVKINNVSEYVQKGYIATEDKRFLTHIGFDVQSLARAGLSLVKNDGEITQGGSTITQQLIKNTLLSQEQTYSRKLTELLLAPRVEQQFSKAEILEFYVNTCYYGNNCYGIETASRYYFGKHCKDLSLAEAAMLCGVSNSPNNYNPIASMKLAKEKMEQVLTNMEEEGYITEKEHLKASKIPIKIKSMEDKYDSDNYMISYALYCTALQLMQEDGFEFKYTFSSTDEEENYKKKYSDKYSEKATLIRSGGFKIYTSFDPKLQKKLQKAVDNNTKAYTDKQKNGKYSLQSSAVCVDNETGYVVAMVGGRGKKDAYNRAFLSARQPGSSIKPLLVYAPAINEGVIVPSTYYDDKKVTVTSGTFSYSPTNSGGGYRGSMQIREALARSINTIAFQIYRNTGANKSISYLDKMHFSNIAYADNYALSLCLGGFTNGVKVVDLAKGYSTIAMGGKYSTRSCIKNITHEIDGVIYKEKDLTDTQSEVFTEDTAFMMQDMMQGTLKEEYGTAHSIYNNKMIAGGKTGTTSSNKDAWFSGFSKYYTTSVWVGYDIPRVMSGMYGGTVPARIWSSFMNNIPKNLTQSDFDKPETISLRHVSGSSYSGDDITLKDDKWWYSQRRGGTDWYSQLNQKVYKKKQEDMKLKAEIAEAKKYLTEFESYYINNLQDALDLDDRYEQTLNAIDNISDEYKASKYRTRAVKHYEELQDVVMGEWQEYIDEYKKTEAKRKENANKVALEDSRNAAATELKADRESKAEWYINELNNRTYNTSVTQLLYQDAKEAIERLKGYSSYSEYKQRLKEAKAYIDSLPTEVPKPVIEEDDSDYEDIDDEKYLETYDESENYE